MRCRITALVLVTLMVSTAAFVAPAPGPETDREGPLSPDRAVQGLEMAMGDHFTINRGQIPYDDVHFHSTNAYFTSEGMVLRVMASDPGATIAGARQARPSMELPSQRMHIIGIDFLGAVPTVPTARDALAHESNYYLGSSGDSWFTGLPNYGQIVYEDLYDGIDLVYRATPEGLKYDLLVGPGADVTDIGFGFQGAQISTDGEELYIETSVGIVRDGDLYAYQVIDGTEVQVEARFVVEDNRVGFDVAYDHGHLLVIDPLYSHPSIERSTFIGGSGVDYSNTMAFDSSGNLVMAGSTTSPDFPIVPGAYDDTYNGAGTYDVSVFSLDPTMAHLIHSTYLGGSLSQLATDIVLDAQDNIYVTGSTTSEDFPTTSGAYNETYPGGTSSVFVTKLNSTGGSLLYSTYVGTGSTDYPTAIDIDAENNTYITGYFMGDQWPTTPGAYCETAPVKVSWWSYTTFVIKLDVDGSDLIYSTCLGGRGFDYAYDIEVDPWNNAIVGGYTTSDDFPIAGYAYDPIFNDFSGGSDIFVTKLNAAGSGLIFSTYIGGTRTDGGSSTHLELDSEANIYLASSTTSFNFPVTPWAYDLHNDVIQSKGVVLKLKNDGSDLLFATYLGSNGTDSLSSLSIDDDDNIHITGVTTSEYYPTTEGANDTEFGGQYDTFISVLNHNGTELLYSTFIGGASVEYGVSILTADGYTYLTGHTASQDFPVTQGAYQTVIQGSYDAYVMRVTLPDLPEAPSDVIAVPGDGYIQLDWAPPENDGRVPIIGYDIFRGTDAANTNLTYEAGIATSFNDTNVTNGQVQYYRISARNSMGPGPLTEGVMAVPGDVPTPPGSLACDEGDGYLNISWATPLDHNGFEVTGYRIYRGDAGDNLSFYRTIGNDTYFNDTPLLNGTAFFYAVSADNLRGESRLSNVVNGTPGRVPDMVAGLNVTEGDGYITITWDEPYDGGHAILGYDVSKGSDEEDLSPFLELGPGTMSFKDNDVENGVWYAYGISAFNDLGEADMAITTGAPGLVAGPVVLTATPGDRVVELGWTEPKETGGFDEYHYGIERGTSVTELLPLAETGNRTYSDTDVENGVLYHYRVFVINHIGEGARGEIVSVRPVGPPSPPQDPVAVGGDGSVRISWDLPADENGASVTMYKVYRGRDPANMTFLSNATGLSLTDDEVINGVRYHYAISALNSGGEGNMSAIVEAMPRGKPGAVRQLTAVEGNGSVKASWEEPAMDGGAEVLGYKVFIRRTGSNWSVPGEANDTSHTVTGLTNGQTYQLKVVAFNVVGEGPAPDMLNLTPGKVPAGPTDLKAKVSDGKVKLSWGPPADEGGHPITQYRVYRGNSKDKMELWTTCNGTSLVDKDIDEGVKYHYKVTAVNIRGEGEPSDTVSVTPASSGPLSGALVPVALVLVIVVVVIGLLLVMRRRGKGPEPEQNGQEEEKGPSA